jgi:cell division septal protein FtsQ
MDGRQNTTSGQRQGQQFLRGPRPRRLSLKRRRRRRVTTGTAITLLAILSAIAGWMLGAQLLHVVRSSPALGVVALEINSCPRVNRAELTALNRTVEHQVNIFSIHLGQLAREVEQHRWVQSCSIKRILPDRLRVRVEEKVPAVLARHGDRLLLLGRQGEVIEVPPASEAWAGMFPLLTGFSDETAWEAHQGRVRKNLPLVDLLQALEQGRAIPRVVRIDLSETNNNRIHFEGREYPVLIGDNGYSDKLARYQMLEKILEERHGDNLLYVDLRFRDRVIVKPALGTGEEGRI